VGRSADNSERGAEENRVVVNADAIRLVPKRSNRGEDFSPCKGCIGLEFQRHINYGGSGIAHRPYDIAVARKVKSIGRNLDIQGQSVERIRRVAVANRASVDIGHNRFGNGTIRAKRLRGKLRETEDTTYA
jgi:hypothetical protein